MKNDVQIINKVGPIQIGNTYIMSDGFYAGNNIVVEWICPQKQIHVGNNIMCRQIRGRIVGTSKRTNYVLEYLKEYLDLKNLLKYKNMLDFDLIMSAKRGNKEAVKEFIRRYKKMPKITLNNGKHNNAFG